MKNNLKEKLEKMENAKTHTELSNTYADVINALGMYYKELISKIDAANEKEDVSNESSCCQSKIQNESKDQDEENSLKDSEHQNISETNSEVETASANEEQDSKENNQTQDDTPVYAVFYSLNNAAYVAIDERIHACVPVRNIAKAYCTTADANGIMNGQNELSRYKLDKLKPIQIKFLTQREYDNTIGRAKEMEKLMANMPKVEDNGEINLDKKVQNFASGSGSGDGSMHIGAKRKDSFNYNRYYHSYQQDEYEEDEEDYGNQCCHGLYKRSYKNPYSSYRETMPEEDYTNSSTVEYPSFPLRDKMENPRLLYISMHDKIDDEDVFCPRSFENDIPKITRDVYDDIDDYAVLIPLIRETMNKIAGTKSGWLSHVYMSTDMEIDIDYMMEIDYSLMDKAIHEWKKKNKGLELMYVEEFDPTIVHFKRNIENIVNKDKSDYAYMLAAYAIYNYARCILAYEEYIRERSI